MTTAGKTLSPIAYKALMYLIWVCNLHTPGVFEQVELSITELGEALGYKKDHNRNFSHNVKRVCTTIKEIMSKPIQINDIENQQYIAFTWIQYVNVNYRNDSIKVLFGAALTEYFGQELKKNFTVVRLKYLNRLSTVAAVLLYPFFCRYVNLGKFQYHVEELSKLLTGKNDYEYRFLKKDHLQPALKAINENTDISIEIREIKTGRRVSHLFFVISRSPAIDEIVHFMEYNNLKLDELATCPYDDKWKKAYTYDMATQSYQRTTEP